MRIVIFCIWDEDEDFSGLSLAKYLGAVKFTISDDSLLRLLFFSWFLSVLILQVIEVKMSKYELIVARLRGLLVAALTVGGSDLRVFCG